MTTTKWSRRRRYTRAVCYLLVLAAGLASIIWPPRSVTEATATAQALSVVWAAMMALGSALAAWGALRGRWIGEYVGLWPLIASAVIFAFAAASSGRGFTTLAGALFLAGFAGFMFSRWQEVSVLRAEAAAAKREQERNRAREQG